MIVRGADMARAWLMTAVVVALASCAQSPAYDADAYELGNLDPANQIPKSSPSQLAKTFASACIDGPKDFAAAEAALRKQGFVPYPSRDDLVTFVSDDRRPAVQLSKRGDGCVVAASARTGQTEELLQLVARRFPQAQPLDAESVGRDLERAWKIDGGILFLLRSGSPYATSRLMFGIWHSNPSSR